MRLYQKEELELSDPDDASNKEQVPGLKGSSKMLEEKVYVISGLLNIQAIRPFDQSKGQVCALVPGQALDCGIGPTLFANGVTYLTAKDALRGRTFAEWLEVHRSQDSHQSILSTLQSKEVSRSTRTLKTHVPDIPNIPFRVYHFIPGISLSGILFIILPAVYGGIHLTTWKFRFPSKTEQLLWRIACFNIMGLIPITWLYMEILMHFLGRRNRDQKLLWDILFLFFYSFFFALCILCILSRLYIVIEAFISLRHIPIGVYAAVPWVQAIPHV